MATTIVKCQCDPEVVIDDPAKANERSYRSASRHLRGEHADGWSTLSSVAGLAKEVRTRASPLAGIQTQLSETGNPDHRYQ